MLLAYGLGYHDFAQALRSRGASLDIQNQASTFDLVWSANVAEADCDDSPWQDGDTKLIRMAMIECYRCLLR